MSLQTCLMQALKAVAAAVFFQENWAGHMAFEERIPFVAA